MTEREALKLALVALEVSRNTLNASRNWLQHRHDVTHDLAITAIKEALAQPDVDRRSTESKETFDQQEPVTERLMDCDHCGGTGVDGDVDDRGRTFDVQCRSCAGSGKSRYFGKCADGKRCLQGCLGTEGCYWKKRAAKEQPAQQQEQEHMKRPLEHEYTSQVAYTRALEVYCDSLANVPASDTLQDRVDETAKQRHETVAASKKDEVFAASIEFIGTLTGMTPPPIEVAPPEVFKPFRDFTEKVCLIFATSHQTKLLTDEEVKDIFNLFPPAECQSYEHWRSLVARAIETKLMQKNGYAEEKNT